MQEALSSTPTGTGLQSQHLGGRAKEEEEFTAMLGYITGPGHPVLCETLSQGRGKKVKTKWSVGFYRLLALVMKTETKITLELVM